MATFGLRQIRTVLAGEGHEPLSEMRITQLVREGMPKAAHGQYAPERCMYWYIGFLRRTVARRETTNEDGSSSNLTGERKRLLAVQAQRAELELDKARGSTIGILEHAKAISDIVIETRARLMAVPGRAAVAVLNESSRVMAQAKIEKEIRHALADLAKYIPRVDVPLTEPAKAAARQQRAKPRRRKP
jgi:phage terminase Nu1 subunit (DNA packaging protein)